MLYLVEVSDSIRYLESRLDEISEKTDTIDMVAGRVEGLPIQELLARVDTLEVNVGRTGNYEYEDSSLGFFAHMEGRINELDNSQKTLLEMIHDMSEDFRATLDVFRNKIADVNTRLNLTMRAMANQVPVGWAVPITKVKVSEPKPFYGVRDAKALENFIQEGCCTIDIGTLVTMHLCEDAKLWWSDSQDPRRHQSSSLRRNRNSRPSSPKAASLIPDSDDKLNQAEGEVGQIERGGKTRIGAIKYLSSLQKKSRERNVPTKRGLLGQTSKTPLGEGFKKNEGREFCCPTCRRASETNSDKVIPMPSAKCLVITESFPIVVQANIRQLNGFKMISTMKLDKSLAQGKPSSATILLGALEKLGDIIPKDTLCVPKKCHGMMPNSWPKSLSMQRRTDHGIEPPSEAKAPAKNSYRTMPSKLAVLRKQSKKLLDTGVSRPVQAPWGAQYSFPLLPNLFDRSRGVKYFPKSDIRPRYCRVRATKAEGLETTCVTGLRAYEFPVVPFSFTDAKEGKCCSVQGQINVMGHVVESHQIEAAFNGMKQAMIKGTNLGVTDATKPPKVEAEQFNSQFGHNTQTDLLIRRIQFEIKGNRHSVLLLLADDPYVEDDPQVHKVEEKWEQIADIARVCLEKASRPMEEREEDREVKEVLADIVRTGRRPTREIHKFLVKWKKPLVEVTSGEHVEDLETWM
ncbi:reverse transcriptase [Cucumis melo var. makuwa]|uniref:Reverse transcriptase n=1 Tax=Cucumis melo var. makuwa TaxID=1194695 RepID=A0A5A7T038_CUCMM|nr:reverse transcriptase [Cucumis melo var. makuwa]